MPKVKCGLTNGSTILEADLGLLVGPINGEDKVSPDPL